MTTSLSTAGGNARMVLKVASVVRRSGTLLNITGALANCLVFSLSASQKKGNSYGRDRGVSINGIPPNGWFIIENPIKVDDDWGYPY